MPPELFTAAELRTFMNKPDLSDDAAALALALATVEIRNLVRPAVYDALTDVTAFKGIALRLGKAFAYNPNGHKSEKIDDYEYVNHAADSAGPLYLTDAEIDRIGKLLGRGGPHSIRPGYPSPTYSGVTYSGAGQY